MITRTISQLNAQGDFVVVYHDGLRQVGAALIEAEYAQEELKGEVLNQPTKLRLEKPATASRELIKEDKERKAKEPETIDPNVENPFKTGDSVLCDGKPFEVMRAYVYKGKPYCILSDKKQVAAKKLTLNKIQK